MTDRSPFDGTFWTEEERLAWDAIAPMLLAVLHAGGERGAAQLPQAYQDLLQWDEFNNYALEYLDTYRESGAFAQISDYTRRETLRIVEDWRKSGASFLVLEKALDRLYDRNRAERVAVTEITRLLNEGMVAAWRATGVVAANIWYTMQDERVCPLCGPLHGKVVQIGGLFVQDIETVAKSPQLRAIAKDAADLELRRQAERLLRAAGFAVAGPPRHPRCRCYLQPVIIPIALEGGGGE